MTRWSCSWQAVGLRLFHLQLFAIQQSLERSTTRLASCAQHALHPTQLRASQRAALAQLPKLFHRSAARARRAAPPRSELLAQLVSSLCRAFFVAPSLAAPRSARVIAPVIHGSRLCALCAGVARRSAFYRAPAWRAGRSVAASLRWRSWAPWYGSRQLAGICAHGWCVGAIASVGCERGLAPIYQRPDERPHPSTDCLPLRHLTIDRHRRARRTYIPCGVASSTSGIMLVSRVCVAIVRWLTLVTRRASPASQPEISTIARVRAASAPGRSHLVPPPQMPSCAP